VKISDYFLSEVNDIGQIYWIYINMLKGLFSATLCMQLL